MGPFWNYSIHSIIYLREYDVGLEAASYLLNLTEQYKKELAEKEWQENRYILHSARKIHDFTELISSVSSLISAD